MTATDAEALRATWKQHYEVAPGQLAKMGGIRGAASVFNANIDAVRKVKPATLKAWADRLGGDPARFLADGPTTIRTPDDVLRGFLKCFAGGIAQEWLVREESAFAWMREVLGHDRLQMGGQGGIISNVLAVCGVQKVYAHCASLPAQQAGLFLDRDNLLSTGADGRLTRATLARRDQDLPLIHWILEFDARDEIELGGRTLHCPKSNRFIATWDPENFRLAIDPSFDRALREAEPHLEYALLAGYQMLQHPLADGSSGLARIAQSKAVLDGWRKAHPGLVVHFEFASTQDSAVRKELLDTVAPWADSCGLNEQELIDVLEVMGEKELASECRGHLASVPLFRGLERIFQHTGVARIQLHMLGLYVTLQKPGHRTPPETTRSGMMLAATIAAAKAGTGSIEKEENLFWAHGREVADISLRELGELAAHLAPRGAAADALPSTGIARLPEYDVVAVPTILIERPVTLVGMGDTISSLSLLGAR
jgi:ADP-dependent phosphofructokinase/glucokinase